MGFYDGLATGGLPGMGFSTAGLGPVGSVRDMNVYGPTMGAAAPSSPGGSGGTSVGGGASVGVSGNVGSNAAGPAALLLVTVGLVVLYMATRRIQGSR